MTVDSAVLVGGAVALVVLTAGPLYRAARGPTVLDRAIAVNAVGTTTIVVLAVLAAAFDEPGFLDVALVYAVLNFLLSIGLSRVVLDRGEVL